MLREIEARNAMDTWGTMRRSAREGEGTEELQKQGLPYLDELLQAKPRVLRAVREHKRREAERAAEE